MPVNPQGVSYAIQKAPGGSWHVYADGRRVFVKAGAAAPAAAKVTPVAQPQLNYDSQYYNDVAGQTAQTNQSLIGINASRSADQTNTAEAIRRLQVQRPIDMQNAKQTANKSGLFYSGALGKNLDSIAASYVQRQGDAQAQYASNEAQRVAQAQQAQADLGGYQQTAQANALARQQQALSDQATAGYLVPNPLPAVPKVAIKKAVKVKPKKR